METPVAAPAAAPAATSTPVSTPAPAATPAPESTPAPVESTPVSTPAESTPAATETPAAAATEKPGKPDRATYGDDIEKFLRDTYAWEEENPDGVTEVTGDEVQVTDKPAAEKTPEEIAAEAAAADKPAEEKKTDEPAPTPEGLSKLMDEHPEFKAAIDAAPPAVKGKLFAMARENAKAQPILKIFPNAEAATFANENANQFVGLKTAFQLSDSPEKMKDAAGQFLEQFAIVNDKGEPVLDAKGNPTYGDDLPLFTAEIKGRDNAVRMGDLKARIEANSYTTPEGKDNDEQLLAAYEFIAAAESADPDALDKPDMTDATPEQKAWFEKQEKKIAEEKERLGLKDKDLTKKGIAETRARLDTKYRETFGGNAGKFIANYLKQKETDGVAIPRYLLTMKDPQSGISVFAKMAFQKLNERLDTQPNIKAHSATLQMNAINDQGLEARVKYGQERIDDLMPSIIDDLLNEAGVAMKQDAEEKIAARDNKRQDARTEPSTSGTSNPGRMTDEQLMAKAKENVLANAKAKGQYIEPGDLIQKTLVERNRLEAQR